jgi:hypothetical protein
MISQPQLVRVRFAHPGTGGNTWRVSIEPEERTREGSTLGRPPNSHLRNDRNICATTMNQTYRRVHNHSHYNFSRRHLSSSGPGFLKFVARSIAFFPFLNGDPKTRANMKRDSASFTPERCEERVAPVQYEHEAQASVSLPCSRRMHPLALHARNIWSRAREEYTRLRFALVLPGLGRMRKIRVRIASVQHSSSLRPIAVP